jgi:hypothetical protein
MIARDSGGTISIDVKVPARHDSETRQRDRGYVTWSRSVPVHQLFHANGRVNTGLVKATVQVTIRCIELHEVDEWLRWDGKPLHRPHF